MSVQNTPTKAPVAKKRAYQFSNSKDEPYAIDLFPLSKREQFALVRDAHANYQQLFSAMQLATKGDGSTSGTQMGNANGKTPSTVMLTASTVAFGTLEEVAALYVAEANPIVLDFAKTKQLYRLQPPDKDNPLRCVGLRWSRAKSPSKLVEDRDLVYLEYMDEFVCQQTGRRGWARATKSIQHPSCPPSHHINGPIRANLFCSGIIITETDRYGVLEQLLLVHVDLKGVPSWIGQKAMHTRKKAAENLSHVLKVTRQMSQPRDGLAELDGDVDNRKCRSCREHVSKWTRAKHCRYCQALLCKNCAEIPYFNDDVRKKNMRICLPCSTRKDHLQQQQEQRLPVRMLSSPLSSSTDSSGLSRRLLRGCSSNSMDTESVTSSHEDGESATLDRMDQLRLGSPLEPNRTAAASSASSSSSSSTVGATPRMARRRLSSAEGYQRPQQAMDLSYLSAFASNSNSSKASTTTTTTS